MFDPLDDLCKQMIDHLSPAQGLLLIFVVFILAVLFTCLFFASLFGFL